MEKNECKEFERIKKQWLIRVARSQKALEIAKGEDFKDEYQWLVTYTEMIQECLLKSCGDCAYFLRQDGLNSQDNEDIISYLKREGIHL